MRAWSLLVLMLAAPVMGATPVAKPPLTPDLVTPLPAAASPLASQAVCTIGTSGPAAYVVGYLQPPDDAYYLRVQPSTCAACAGKPGVWISSVRLKLEFQVACSQPAEVSVVSMLGDTACAPPDPPRVMRGPVAVMLTAPAPGIHEFSVPLDGPVALLQDAYLRVTFTADGVGCACPCNRPRLVTTSSCVDCVAWNYYPDGTDDLCQLLFPGTPIIYADVDSCVSPSLADVDGTPRAHGLRAAPDPARSHVELSFALSAPTHARLTVCDVSGRHVRELLDATLPAGGRSIAWDGRDEDGARVRPGAYFAVLRLGDQMAMRRVVMLGADR